MKYRRIAITGGYGFLGWHAACRLRALHGVEPIRLGREEFAQPDLLRNALGDVDAVLHIAGVNRADSDAEVEHGNVELARGVALALSGRERPVDVVYANSVQADNDTPYGRGKARAADILGRKVRAGGGNFADLRLPNLFGEHGRPAYNSFVATFAHEVAHGRTPQVTDDRQIELLHAQGAAESMLRALGSDLSRSVSGELVRISDILTFFVETHAAYASRGEIPDLKKELSRDLFNTYRASAFASMWPISPAVHADARGRLFETFRNHGGTGMGFMSTTLPGQVRGEHYHLHKVERFFVVQGTAEIQLRRLLHDEVTTFLLDGKKPSFVDMPTMWVHNIRNVGSSELVTMFWSDQLLDTNNPDQFPETIDQGANL